MSRALDTHIHEALKHANPEKSFEYISAALLQKHDALLEIELLGPSHGSIGAPLLQDGNALAIPKLRLVEAFIQARARFRSRQRSKDDLRTRQRRLLATTAVMLLMDPEHLTAANARKEMLSEALEAAPRDVAPLLDEKFLIDSLLTSRLHRHTKSPTLWSHRRWLVRKLITTRALSNPFEDLTRVIFVSAERHPRNYYAWGHARLLVDLADVGEAQNALDAGRAVTDTKKWCFRHHDDVSGWMFLASLLQKWPSHSRSVLRETLKCVESFRWRNESVWYFLRSIWSVGSQASGLSEVEFRTICNSLRKNTTDNGQSAKVLDAALSWFDRYSGL